MTNIFAFLGLIALMSPRAEMIVKSYRMRNFL
jgi:hypothetical protein